MYAAIATAAKISAYSVIVCAPDLVRSAYANRFVIFTSMRNPLVIFALPRSRAYPVVISLRRGLRPGIVLTPPDTHRNLSQSCLDYRPRGLDLFNTSVYYVCRRRSPAAQ